MTNIIPEPPVGVWPLSKLSFLVKWDNNVMLFQEVSGLGVVCQPIEYRRGDSPIFTTLKMPGIKKFGNVTMKKGILKSEKNLCDWFNQIQMNTIKRVPLTIALLDEAENPTMVWTLCNARPTKITGTDRKDGGKDVTVESIEIVHEGITIANR